MVFRRRSSNATPGGRADKPCGRPNSPQSAPSTSARPPHPCARRRARPGSDLGGSAGWSWSSPAAAALHHRRRTGRGCRQAGVARADTPEGIRGPKQRALRGLVPRPEPRRVGETLSRLDPQDGRERDAPRSPCPFRPSMRQKDRASKSSSKLETRPRARSCALHRHKRRAGPAREGRGRGAHDRARQSLTSIRRVGSADAARLVRRRSRPRRRNSTRHPDRGEGRIDAASRERVRRRRIARSSTTGPPGLGGDARGGQGRKPGAGVHGRGRPHQHAFRRGMTMGRADGAVLRPHRHLHEAGARGLNARRPRAQLRGERRAPSPRSPSRARARRKGREAAGARRELSPPPAA